MDPPKEKRERVHVERVFGYSRLAPQLMAAAYEKLVPIRRMPLLQEPQTKRYEVTERYLCAL